MYDEIIKDLRTALESGRYVDVELAGGESVGWRRVLDLNEEGGWVGIHDSQNLADLETQRKIRLDQIVGLTLHTD